jgi:hypothetical protein
LPKSRAIEKERLFNRLRLLAEISSGSASDQDLFQLAAMGQNSNSPKITYGTWMSPLWHIDVS